MNPFPLGTDMGWWRFQRKKQATKTNDPILKDTRTWLAELRDACEIHFDKPEQARQLIREMQVEWHDAQKEGDMPSALHDGLESRAFRLLTCSDAEWMAWLDDLEFWKAGWKPYEDDGKEA